MKAAPFSYARAANLEQACDHLAESGDDARLIAGGQTLVPLMAMRLVRPAVLIDLNPAAELDRITRTSHGGARYITIGTLTRQARSADSPEVLESIPLLVRALAHVGHPPTRALGTVGGSIANADPAAEIALVAQVLGAEMTAARRSGPGVDTRRIPAADFFIGPMETSLGPTECLVEIRFPDWTGGRIGGGFAEVAPRDGDFAIVAAAAQVRLDEHGRCLNAAFGVTNAAATPLAADEGAIRDVIGTVLDAAAITAAANSFSDRLEPAADAHASAEYRRALVPTLVARALEQARDTALAGANSDRQETGGTA